jgi:hypothetical protein
LSIGKLPPPDDTTWDHALTLEQWITKMIREGHFEIVKSLMQAMPEHKKAYYREVWAREIKARGQ